MSRQNFTGTIGDLNAKGELIVRHAPAALDKLKSLDPASVIGLASGLTAADAVQESLKGNRSNKTGAKAITLEDAMDTGSVVVLSLKAGIAKLKKTDPAQAAVLEKSLPRVSTARTDEEKVGTLAKILAFISNNPAVAGKVTPDEVATLAAGSAASNTAIGASRKAKVALPEATSDLVAALRRAQRHATAWLDLIAAVHVLTDNEAGEAEIQAARANRTRKKKRSAGAEK